MREFINHAKFLLADIIEWYLSHPFWYKIITAFIIFIAALWGEISVFIYSMFILTFLDTHYGIKASHKLGIKFDSKKRRKGLLDKSIIYMTVLIMTLIIDSMALSIYDFGKHYLTSVLLLFAGLYEATSIVEKLKVLYPESRLIKQMGKIFMLFETNLEKKIKNNFEETDVQPERPQS